MCIHQSNKNPEYWNPTIPEAIFADNIVIFTDNFQKEFMVQLETFTKWLFIQNFSGRFLIKGVYIKFEINIFAPSPTVLNHKTVLLLNKIVYMVIVNIKYIYQNKLHNYI